MCWFDLSLNKIDVNNFGSYKVCDMLLIPLEKVCDIFLGDIRLPSLLFLAGAVELT